MSMVENWAFGEQERGSAVKSSYCSTLRAAAQIPAPRSSQKTRHFIIKLFQKVPFKTNLARVVAHTLNPSIQAAETSGTQSEFQAKLHKETLSKKQSKKESPTF